VGDLRDEDLVSVGAKAAPLFNEVIVRMDDHLRRRTMEEIFQLVSAGIKAVDNKKKITLIPGEAEAIRTAIGNVRPQVLLLYLLTTLTRQLI
jgi:cyanophycin synthetase